jgi:putative nucleotidyltransferase with HDIG domain
MADRFETAFGADEEDGEFQPVIRKRFDSSKFDWLSSLTSDSAPGSEYALLQRAQRHLSTLHQVSSLLAAARDLAGLSDITVKALIELTAADRAALVLRREDPSTGGAEIAAAAARRKGEPRFTVSRALVADVIEKGVSRFVNAGAPTGDDRAVRSVMCVPLRTSDEVLGALYVDAENGSGQLTEADLELLAAVGNQAGVALHRVRLMDELGRLHLDTIRAIAATIDAKDGYTHRHSERVATLAGRIALEIGLDRDAQETAELSALLHDLGKIAVPDSILNKPARLTAEEFEEMKKHPVHGATILAKIQSAAVMAVIPGVQYHHERWDGTGYPEGLRGEAIPLLGRLLGVADFLDALTSTRAYRAPVPLDDAVRLVAEGSGTHFDPRIADAAVRLHARGGLL